MKRRIASILSIVVILLHCGNASYAQLSDSAVVDSAVSSAMVDTTNDHEDKDQRDTVVQQIYYAIQSDSIKKYKGQKPFAYIYSLDSILKASANLKIDTINADNLNRRNNRNSGAEVREDRSNSVSIFDNLVMRIILWIMAIGFIGFVLYKLFLGEGVFRKEPVGQRPVDTAEDLPVDPASYEGLISEAVANKNFRLATRYHYLQTLQHLSQAGVIQFTADKTNYEYVRELAAKSYQHAFSGLTRNYEYVWYGHFDINDARYAAIRENFREFTQKIKSN